MRLGTLVTNPVVRDPTVTASLFATLNVISKGRMDLGIGRGDSSRRVMGKKPATMERLEEAVSVIRLLWKGGIQSHRGRHFTVENACVYTLPENTPQIYVAAGGEKMSQLAAQIGDGLITAGDEGSVIKAFNTAGGKKRPKFAQLTVCWAKTEKEARQTLRRHFEQIGFRKIGKTKLDGLSLSQVTPNLADIIRPGR